MFTPRAVKEGYIDKTDMIHPGALWYRHEEHRSFGITRKECHYVRIISISPHTKAVSCLLYKDVYAKQHKRKVIHIERLRDILNDKGYKYHKNKNDMTSQELKEKSRRIKIYKRRRKNKPYV